MKAADCQFSRGDRVRLRCDRESAGTVVAGGPEQSEVRWDGDTRNSVVPTSWLVPVVERARLARG